MIPGPLHPKTHPDRDAECEDALHAAFRNLRRQAEAAGWSPGEVSRALLALSVANIRAAIGQAAATWSFRAHRDGP
jgi:hypothetical protein